MIKFFQGLKLSQAFILLADVLEEQAVLRKVTGER